MRNPTWPSLVLTALILSACGAGDDFATASQAGVVPTASGGTQMSWGDGRRTVSLYGNIPFVYTPVLAADAPPETVREVAISAAGKVTVLRVRKEVFPTTGQLNDSERKAWGAICTSITFDYAGCPREPGTAQPIYTWVYLGGQYEGRPACPPNPTGLTIVLAPETVDQTNAFLDKLVLRLTGKALF